MLTKEQQAHAINWAMRYDIEGNTERFERFAMFLNRRPNLKADILNFYKGLSPMTQRAYIALMYMSTTDRELTRFEMFREFYKKSVHVIITLGGAILIAKMFLEWLAGI